jgi:PAS domain S-box-containing protein
MLKNLPIQRKLMVIILLTTIATLLLMRGTLLTCEFLRFEHATTRQLATVGEIIAANSTAALAFANQGDAEETLSALKAERYITAAALYDKDGKLFSKYPADLPDDALPAAPQKDGVQFEHSFLAEFQPVVQGEKRLGTLYLRFDMGTLKHEWLRISISITLAVIAAVILVAYLLSQKLQQHISKPILALAETARAISDQRDYSVRAKKFGADEVGLLTDAFNQMVEQVQKQNRDLLQFAAIVTSSDDAIISKNLDGIITSWNHGAEKLFGYPAPEVIGRPLLILVPPDRADEEPRILAHVAHGESLDHFETVRVKKDGTRIDIAATVSPIRDAHGKVVGISKIARDITERIRVKAEIQKLNLELERRVIERTAQLETANKELEAFSYSVSHDLRAPLRAVNGFAGIVLEQFGPQIPAEAARYLERIRSGGQRMGQLIDDLLEFSRLGRQSMNRHAVDSAKLVQAVLDESAPQREGRPIEIHVRNLPECQGDSALLKQVWTNLISNAIKYTRGREPAVIDIGCDVKDDEEVYFVRDNGAGFEMTYAHKLFGVFQRLHREDQFEGTGVGLAIVQRIVHRHGGRVWAEAELGKGAAFYFTLKEKTKL